ncbi:MAG TPA: PAS domain S-box protein [Steroidobacteraceae bacterium]|nr:PAS domain S-box protein [Steroidobacteraceae bacterium]
MADDLTKAARASQSWRYYVIAFVLVALTLMIRIGIKPWDDGQALLIIFVFPIVISAYLGGLGPGLLATVLGGIAADWFVLVPIGSFGFSSPPVFAQWLMFQLVGVLISVLLGEVIRLRATARGEFVATRRATTEQKVRLGFAVAILFLGTIGIVSYLSVVRLNDNSQLVMRSHLVMANIDALVATTWETESAQRAYLLTGEEPFAAEYTRAVGRVDGLVQQLRDSVSTEPEQVAHVEALADAVRARLAHSADLLELRRNQGMDAVRARLGATPSRPGASLQNRVRNIARELKTDQIRLLNAREDTARRSAQMTQGVIVGGSALALVFVGLALFAIRRDFAGRERAETELTEFFELSTDILCIAGGDGYFKRISPAVTDILGYSVDEILKLNYMELLHPDDRARATEAVRQQLEENRKFITYVGRSRHKDGSYRMLSWQSTPRGDLLYANARDVTNEARAAEELRQAKEQLEQRVDERTRALAEANETLHKSERRFRALIENGADSIALIDGNNNILYLSPAVSQVEGYAPEELIGHNGLEHTHPDDLPVIGKAVEQLLASPGKPIPVIWRRRHKDGRWIWLEGVATNLLDDPSVRAIVTNYRDITERLAHEARLSEQLQRLALLARITRAIGERQDLTSIFQVMAARLEEELPVDFCCIFLYDNTDNRLSVTCVSARSLEAAERLGLYRNTVVPIDENGLSRCIHGHLVYEPDIAAVDFPFPRRLASVGLGAMVIAPLLVESQVFGVLVCARKAAQSFTSGDCEFLRQASEHTALAAHQAQLYTALQQAYDDLRQTQQQVMQQERLRALGQMASGIAHDINNAISPVALYTEALLEREHDLTDKGRKQLEIIQRAVDDVAQTVARMGEFYRAREPQSSLVPVDINKLVRQVLDLTRARWSDMVQRRGSAIDVHLELADNLPPIAVAESQVRDALVNLVFNAVDAMPQGGPLTLRTRIADGSGRHIVQLEVVDAGIGMDEDTRRRCLEPFFTTKGTRGTGLGLAMVYGVAQRHNANLEIESEPGKGTLVRMSFAAAPEPVPVAPGTQRAPVGPMRILLIDDDPLLLKSLRDTLESEGHDITAVNGGQAGINTFVESHALGAPFPLVITDLGMPHVDGRKVAATVKASVPQTVVIMLTGWGRRLVAEGDVPPGVDQVLSKPPKLIELRAAISTHFGK